MPGSQKSLSTDPDVRFSANGHSRSASKKSMKSTSDKSDHKSTKASTLATVSHLTTSAIQEVTPGQDGKKSPCRSKAASKATSKSKMSRQSTAASAKRAALMAEAAALGEKEKIDQQMLELQQKAKRLELKTEMEKLRAEQEILEEAEAEAEKDLEDEDDTAVSEQERMQRVQSWVDAQKVSREEQLQHEPLDVQRETRREELEPEPLDWQQEPRRELSQPEPSYVLQEQRREPQSMPLDVQRESRREYQPKPSDTRVLRGDRSQLDPLGFQLDPTSLPFHPGPPQNAVSTGLIDMLQTLHLPKTEMMTFNGDPIKFWTFIKAFDNTIGKHNIDEHAKLARLLQYCTGKAYKVIEGCAAMCQGGYARARQLLQERFGDKYAISTSWVNRVTSGHKITNDSLQEFADELLSFRETLYAIGCLSEVNQRVLVQIVEQLPVYLQHRWKRQVSKLRERAANPGIDDLVYFVQSVAKEVNDPVFGELGVVKAKPTSQHGQFHSNQPGQRKGFHGATAAGPRSDSAAMTSSARSEWNQSKKQCVACQSNCSSLFQCGKFKGMSPEKRFELAKEKRLCYNCLKGNHSSAECKAEKTCRAEGCKLKHTKFLHTSTKSLKAEPAGQPAENAAVCSYTTTSRTPRVVLPVVQVKVTGQSGQSAVTYALLDNGSTNTFCSTALINKLASKGERTYLGLTTLHSEGSKQKTTIHKLQVADPQGHHEVLIQQVYATQKIPVARDCTVTAEDLKSWEHLKDIAVPMLSDGQVEMLIGQDCPEVLTPLEVRTPSSPELHPAPFAVRTVFGWTVNGPLDVTQRASGATVHLTTLEQKVEAFWKVEGADISSTKKGFSVEDSEALSIMQSSIKNNEEGRYSVAIPFRAEAKSSLPNNKILAEKRLEGLARKLAQNPALQRGYVDAIDTLIEKGYAERVTDEGRRGATWYIPHHPVINPNKTKIRVVFDCAAKYRGASLNDKVLQGPDFTNGLFGILLRFREFPVAVSADIEAMFHQVEVPPDDRDTLRFLWWPNGDADQEPETYRMTRHLFGGTWSPSVCTYALQQTARDNSQSSEPEVTNAILQDFYVDDFLKSVKTVPEAIKMARELTKLIAGGGFRLCKWLSNEKEVLEAVPDSERTAGVQDLHLQALPVERTLGVLWDVNTDAYTYAMKQTRHPPTRRGLLGAVCSVYDPMGYIAPFTIRGKLLVQDLTRDEITWDEPLPDHHLTRWHEWLNEMEAIEEIKIDRCLQPAEFGEVISMELHHFADASTAAYGAASYLRLVNTRGQVRCNLLFARSRVAPLKQMTIPRLELAAAALSVQQDEMIRRELSLSIGGSVFWTDSTIVLAYIRNEKRRFHTYVANRLAVIHAGSTLGQWRHVPSEQNPADDITRGLSMQELIHRHRWFHGPELLSKVTVTEGVHPPQVNIEHDPEVKHETTACATDTVRDVMSELINRHSSWAKLKHSAAWLLRYRVFLLAKVKGQQPTYTEDTLTVKELQDAERALIKHVQSCEYAQEIQTLKDSTGRINKKNKIYKMDPVLTSEGVLVCSTRNMKSATPGDDTRPVLLPKDNWISTLVVRFYHEQSGHSGREYTVAEVQQKYRIPGLRTLVRRVLGQCGRCRRLFSRPGVQRMADLPEERVATDEPVFTNVGVDCFGPYVIKSGRKQQKRYGCIFTCLTSRAVHLEVLHSMDTSSFVDALQRFISRRGNPKTICCDNGTNFVGAERELRESLAQWNQQTIDAFLRHRDIQWKFNPPGASHMGGAWERLIRSVRRTLSAVMTEQVLTDEALNTLICVVEAIVNSRPLTVVSDTATDPEPLTPNHLLRLRPMPPLPPGVFDHKDCYVRRRWRQVQYLADVFWRRWLREYLPLIQLRTKWHKETSNLKVGDIVLVVDYTAPRNHWQLGRVSQVSVGSDGLVRSAEVRTRTSTLTRPVTKLCYLEGSNE